MDALIAANFAEQSRSRRVSEEAYYRAQEPRRIRPGLSLMVVVALVGALLTIIDRVSV